MLSLSTAPVTNGFYTVKWCFCYDYDLELEKLGIIKGARICILSSCFGDVIISINGKQIALAKEIADKIKV